MMTTNLKLGLGITALLIFLAICFAFAKASEGQNQQMAVNYRHAPNCTPASDPASTAAPCSYESVRVKSMKSTTHKSSTYYTLNLITAEGNLRIAYVFAPLYRLVRPGTGLTAQFWRGQVCSLSYQNQLYQTEQNPEVQAGNSNSEGYALIIFLAGAIGVYFLASWYAQQKTPQRVLPPTPSEYPLVRDEN